MLRLVKKKRFDMLTVNSLTGYHIIYSLDDNHFLSVRLFKFVAFQAVHWMNEPE